ncbi:hypothetical protein HYV91_03775 [Candidatus Wolfebacteria bacterium]|nr:hypothetical protein [Candidatus Wolfebacteria bacterium]
MRRKGFNTESVPVDILLETTIILACLRIRAMGLFLTMRDLIEILLLFRDNGISIREVGVRWINQGYYSRPAALKIASYERKGYLRKIGDAMWDFTGKGWKLSWDRLNSFRERYPGQIERLARIVGLLLPPISEVAVSRPDE